LRWRLKNKKTGFWFQGAEKNLPDRPRGASPSSKENGAEGPEETTTGTSRGGYHPDSLQAMQLCDRAIAMALEEQLFPNDVRQAEQSPAVHNGACRG
jgi:hypothetical protein